MNTFTSQVEPDVVNNQINFENDAFSHTESSYHATSYNDKQSQNPTTAPTNDPICSQHIITLMHSETDDSKDVNTTEERIIEANVTANGVNS